MLLNIRSRMLLAALLPVTLVAALLAAVFLVLRVGDNAETHHQRARSLIRQVASASEYGLFSANTGSLQTIANGILREADVRSATIIDLRNMVLTRVGNASYAKLPDLTGAESEQVDPTTGIDLLVQPITALQIRLDDTPERVGHAGEGSPQLLGHVVMEFSRDSLNRREHDMLVAGVAITLGGLLFGVILAVLIGQGVVSPIMRVSRMIERIGNGELSERLQVQANDPLRDLQKGLNLMAERLESGRDDMAQRIDAATSELREKKEEAEMATLAKSRFLAAASHDLRQPTHALGMFVARLGQLPHGAQTQHLVTNLDASVRAMQDLLDGLLDISRLDAGVVHVNLRAMPVNDLFDQIRHAMTNTATDKGLRLRVRPTRAWVRSDPVLLHRIVQNLVANAVRYTHRGSVLLACRASGTGQVRIEVWDSGIGIAPEHHQQIFGEFYQVGNPERDRTKGLGLGLNIVERTARLLSHAFYLRSSLGQGTRFTLELPSAADASATSFEVLEPTPVASLNGLAVMVIEDDALASEGVVGLLESWGCRVTAADGQQTALQQMQAKGVPDVIMSDYRLRDGENGIEAVNALRAAAGRPIAACLASGDTDQALIQKAKEAQLTLLHKPVRPAKLRSLLRSLAPQNPMQQERRSAVMREGQNVDQHAERRATDSDRLV
jgi:signal transduction histidine kinase/CheY-like chemotaxis protein